MYYWHACDLYSHVYEMQMRLRKDVVGYNPQKKTKDYHMLCSCHCPMPTKNNRQPRWEVQK